MFMKFFKVLFFILIVSLIFSGSLVMGYSHGFTGIKLEALSKIYNSPEMVKTISSDQKVKKISATSDVTGGEVAVEGRVCLKSGTSICSYSSWEDLPKGKWVEINKTNELGTYKLQLHTKRSFLNASTFYGTWWYDAV